MNKICLTLIFSLFLKFIIYSLPNEFDLRMEELYTSIDTYNIPKEWIDENIDNENFEIYSIVPELFSKMAENKYKNQELSLNDYMANFGVDEKVKNGLVFIEKYGELLTEVENKNGIHYEIITSLLAIETNYGNKKYTGNFYLFPTLLTQFLLMPQRRKFALRELYHLYLLKKEKSIDYSYIKGSFAGASGLGQFIPSSIYSFFIDSNNKENEIDIFSMEDNIASIENYLKKNGLNGETIQDDEKLYNAIYSYNRSDAYVKTVIYIYKELYKYRQN